MKLTIDRSRWCRGRAYESQLLRDDGKKCCLGFFAGACGIADDAILDRGEPSNLDDEASRRAAAPWSSLLVECDIDDLKTFENSKLAHRLIEVNDGDSTMFGEREREARIAGLFATIGVEVEFVDGDPP